MQIISWLCFPVNFRIPSLFFSLRFPFPVNRGSLIPENRLLTFRFFGSGNFFGIT